MLQIFSLTCVVDHAAVFPVNAALVMSKWQHPRLNCSLAPAHQHRARGWTAKKAACTIFQVFRITQTAIKPSPAALVMSVLQTPGARV